jgi:hypothetical protein
MSCMGNGGDSGTKTVDVETLSDVHGGMLICTQASQSTHYVPSLDIISSHVFETKSS